MGQHDPWSVGRDWSNMAPGLLGGIGWSNMAPGLLGGIGWGNMAPGLLGGIGWSNMPLVCWEGVEQHDPCSDLGHVCWDWVWGGGGGGGGTVS